MMKKIIDTKNDNFSKDKSPDFLIEIQFDDSSSPSRAFRLLSDILSSFHEVDENLVGSIDSHIKPITILEDLQKGSIKSWFKNSIAAIPDEGLADLDWKKAIGHYLVKGKYLIIQFLDGKTSITSREEIKTLESELYKLAEDTNVNKIPAYSPIPTAKLVSSIKRMSRSLEYAQGNERIIYGTSATEMIDFNMEFNFSPESVEDLLTKERLSNETEMILRVKKPDYLGDSQWELRHEKMQIFAKITDITWLRRFQEREVNVRPGDSLRAKVRTTVSYDYNNEVIGTHYELLEVKDIIKADTSNQIEMFKPPETNI